MTTSNNTFPSRLTKIDELTRRDHAFLEEKDECLFFGDYSARKGFAHSATNQLILNFKKPMRFRDTASWHYKNIAIASAAQALSENLATALHKITLVPVPPSKLRTDSEYDDRLMGMLRLMQGPNGVAVDVRELIFQTQPMIAAHESTSRPRPEEWEKVYAVDESLTTRRPNWIGVVDDLLVTGCRFRAMSSVLRKRFPDARITGLFLARRVPDAIDFAEFFAGSEG